MKFKELSRDELIDLLTDGVPMPDSALIDESTIEFYFSEINTFINLAENEYIAELHDASCIKVYFGLNDEAYLRLRDNDLLLLMSPEMAETYEDMTTTQAENIIGILYGIIVFNQKWIEVNELVDEITQKIIKSFEYNTKSIEDKLQPNVLKKLNKSPVQYPDKTMKIKDFDKYFKKDKDKKYG